MPKIEKCLEYIEQDAGCEPYAEIRAVATGDLLETWTEEEFREAIAAPSLLAAVSSFLSIVYAACEMDEKILRLDELDTQVNLARAAIAEATGGNND